MDESKLSIRLKGFIDTMGLTNSQFADRCGIPRPSVSQLLGGRNKKVNDVIITQIHRAFPNLSVMWLLFGEGDMMLSPASARNECGAGTDCGASGDDDVSSSSGVNSEVSSESTSVESSLDSLLESLGATFVPELIQNSCCEAKLSSENSENAADGSDSQNNSNVRGLIILSEALKSAQKQIVDYETKLSDLQSKIDKMEQNPRRVSHITVYYDDSTFETFYSDHRE